MSEQVILALTTCPDEASAPAVATAVVQERLATCVSRASGPRSPYFWPYFWDARLQDEAEILLIIKTTAGGNERCLGGVRMGVQRKGE